MYREKLFVTYLLAVLAHLGSTGCGGTKPEPRSPKIPQREPTLEERIQAEGVLPSMFVADTSEAAQGEPPEKAFGFTFGSAAEVSEKTCVDSGEKWSVLEEEERCYCSSSPRGSVSRDNGDSDSPAAHAVILKFCEQKICQIFVDVSPAGDDVSKWVEAYQEREAEVIALHGNPTRVTRDIPEKCRHEFLSCLHSGEARVSSLWAWDSGDIISLSMAGDKSQGVPPNISLQYANSIGVQAIEGTE